MKIYVQLTILLCYASLAYPRPQEDSDVKTSTVVDDPPSSTSTTTAPAPAVDDGVAKAVNAFGFKMIKAMMNQSTDQNIVVSPTGVVGLLAMTLLGSAGTTYDEIAELIGFSQDILVNRKYHEDLGSRLRSLSANDTKTLYANAVFVSELSRLRDIFRSYLQRVYHGEALRANFQDGDKVKQMINEWVSNHTNNKIENFQQQPLPASTKAVLLSALYFSGQWAEPFVPEYTRKLPFQTPTKEVLVDLMANFGDFDYIFSFEDGLQMIALPYNDTVTTMYVIKPRLPKRVNLTDLLDRLDYEKIDKLIDHMKRKKCVIRFPKMKLESKVDLKDTLSGLGARSMFTPGVANFAVMLESDQVANTNEEELISRINTGEGEARTLKDMVNGFVNPSVHVDSVMHEVKMTIDEYGTEAVAATSAVMARTAETFYADSPFYLFIRNEKTKLVTFSAIVFDPTIE
ncbi:plasminogen activator inhibitor 1-like [Ostrinia nubilalis]|uniref:plasminogen activator inhibitor 1-like n=1 Tax=Ostrinia nubilalis TaxID=29057 RepID=UPI0030823092